jgi:hypothetical protein
MALPICAQTHALHLCIGQAFERCATELKAQLAGTRSEVEQTQGVFTDAIEKLARSFTGIKAQTRAQQQLLMNITAGQGVGSAPVPDHCMREVAGDLERIEHQLEHDLNAAVTTLQFEDAATQLLEHVKRRADAIHAMADKIGELARALATRDETYSAESTEGSEGRLAARSRTSQTPLAQRITLAHGSRFRHVSRKLSSVRARSVCYRLWLHLPPVAVSNSPMLPSVNGSTTQSALSIL